MELAPRLIDTAVPDRPTGAVIVLHGGASRRDSMAVSPTQLSVLRMIPIAKDLARAGRDLAVLRLLNSRRGWDAHHTPVHDARWALAQVADRFGPELPVCLVGHSLGGRAALLAAGSPQVRGAVALAPWVLPADEPRGLNGQRLLIVHGDRDRVASPERSRIVADRLHQEGHAVEYVVVPGGKHAMLSHHREFSRPAREFVLETLAGPGGPSARRWPSR